MYVVDLGYIIKCTAMCAVLQLVLFAGDAALLMRTLVDMLVDTSGYVAWDRSVSQSSSCLRRRYGLCSASECVQQTQQLSNEHV